MTVTRIDQTHILFATAASIITATVVNAGLPPCPGDINGDGTVAVPDLIELLGAWGENAGGHPADLNEDGHISVPDLLLLLTSWGECPAPTWQDLEFDEEPLEIDLGDGGARLSASVTGQITIAPSGQGEGSLTVQFSDRTIVTLSVAKSADDDSAMHVTIADGKTVAFPPVGPAGLLVDGQFVSVDEVRAAMLADLTSGGLPASYSPSTQAVLANSALGATSAWENNVAVNKSVFNSGGLAGDDTCKPNWICRNTGWMVEAAFVVGGALTCTALTGSCALGSFATIGGLSIPCGALISSCALATWQVPGYLGTLAASMACPCGPEGACCTPTGPLTPDFPMNCVVVNQSTCALMNADSTSYFQPGAVCTPDACAWGMCGNGSNCEWGLEVVCDGTFYIGICQGFIECACNHLGLCDLECP